MATISFRHPLALTPQGYGKPVCRRLDRYPLSIQGKIQEDLKTLLAAQPRLRSEAPEGLHEAALDFWFAPLGIKSKEARTAFGFSLASLRPVAEADLAALASAMKSLHIEADPASWTEQTRRFVDSLIIRIQDLEAQSNGQFKRIRDLEAQLAGLLKETGAKNEAAKAITLGACLDHFKAHLSCKSEAAKKDCLRRVEAVVAGLGLAKPYASITKKTILDEAAKLGGSTTEKAYRLRDFKRFCRLLAFDAANDGLGLDNPAETIKPGTPERKDPEILDPRVLLKWHLSDYWKAFVSVLGFAGLRLGEAASLEWTMLDWKKKIIRLRSSSQYPKLKNAISERDVAPFANCWRWLQAHKKTASHETLVFPRLWRWTEGEAKKTKYAENETWFDDRDGSARCVNLPRVFGEEMEAARPKGSKTDLRQPALRLRHFWVTSLYSTGNGQLDAVMGGHSAETGRKHYLKNATVVEGAKMPLL